MGGGWRRGERVWTQTRVARGQPALASCGRRACDGTDILRYAVQGSCHRSRGAPAREPGGHQGGRDRRGCERDALAAHGAATVDERTPNCAAFDGRCARGEHSTGFRRAISQPDRDAGGPGTTETESDSSQPSSHASRSRPPPLTHLDVPPRAGARSAAKPPKASAKKLKAGEHREHLDQAPPRQAGIADFETVKPISKVQPNLNLNLNLNLNPTPRPSTCALSLLSRNPKPYPASTLNFYPKPSTPNTEHETQNSKP